MKLLFINFVKQATTMTQWKRRTIQAACIFTMLIALTPALAGKLMRFTAAPSITDELISVDLDMLGEDESQRIETIVDFDQITQPWISQTAPALVELWLKQNAELVADDALVNVNDFTGSYNVGWTYRPRHVFPRKTSVGSTLLKVNRRNNDPVLDELSNSLAREFTIETQVDLWRVASDQSVGQAPSVNFDNVSAMIPEPSALALVIAGSVLLITTRRNTKTTDARNPA